MGKAKSKVKRDDSATDTLNQRQTNVNKLIERMNSRTDSDQYQLNFENDEGWDPTKKSNKPIRKEVITVNEFLTGNVNNNDIMETIEVNQKPLRGCEVVCSKFTKDDEVEIPERDVNVCIKKRDSIDDIIDLIVNKSQKRDVELLDADKNVKRSQSYPGKQTKDHPKKYLRVRSCRDEDDEEWEETLAERLNNLQKRAEIFEKRVDSLDAWRQESDFNKNMMDVLEANKVQDENLSVPKTIERTKSSPVDNSFIAAPKADPIIRHTIDRLLDEQRDDADEVKPFCWESSNRSGKRKTYCQTCKKKCSGEVLRVQDKYFHISCFKCKACKNSLAQGGFFFKDGAYYCTNDYQRQFGTKCAQCGQYVEGEVVTALGNTYHQKCFTCARCRQAFPSGERVTYTGKEVLCQRCTQIPIRDARSPATSPAGANAECAGCGEELRECQALIALERQWHIWCFKCKTCDCVLHGEYMGKDGIPYCEKDYQKQYGVKCAYCSRFISGKVLQAGDNHHFHPTCARCTKCGDPFGDGEEMYLQGGAIWHPRCGPGPTENGTVLNGGASLENGHCTDTDGEMSGREGREFDRMSSSAVSETQFSFRSRTPSMNGSIGSPSYGSRKYMYHRTGSPGLILREYKTPQYSEDISRIYTYSYLTEEPSHGYLKRPIDPYDKPPTSPHFHRPSSAHSQRSGSKILVKTTSKSGMKVMAESIRSETPRPRSPHMNNEEPIELAHFPDAKKPKPGEKPKIERDDFPAPPYPYSDPERRKRYSDSYKGLSDDEEDEVDAKEKENEDAKLKKEEEELSKIATGIGKVFLQNVKEREKLRQWKMQHLDPRNASRVPAANKEPQYRLRYQSPVNASPSRNMDHPRPWEEEELMDRSSSYRSSMGRSVGAIPSYNASTSSRPGSSRKAATLPTGRYTSGYCSDYDVGYNGDFSFSGFGEKTHSTEFSSGKSDISGGSISDVDRKALVSFDVNTSSKFASTVNADMPASTTFQGGLRYTSYSPHLRRSLPALSHMNNEPPKIYPYHLLVITNYRLPADVDRCNLERHLSDNEFERLFQCTRTEFYRFPTWRRNEMKRRIKLF